LLDTSCNVPVWRMNGAIVFHKCGSWLGAHQLVDRRHRGLRKQFRKPVLKRVTAPSRFGTRRVDLPVDRHARRIRRAGRRLCRT
jgi:hypothetical protein